MLRPKLLSSVAILALLSIATIVYFATQFAREQARQSACHGQMFYLLHALLNYQAEHGHLPPAFVAGPDGTPWHSWRVLILPYVEHADVYRQYNFDEPWNSPHNLKLAEAINLNLFQCPSGPDRERNCYTNYCVVVSDDSYFPGTQTTSLHQTAVRSSAIALVEINQSDIHWMEPRDIKIESFGLRRGPQAGSPHPSGIGTMRANGHYQILEHNFAKEQWMREVRATPMD